MSMTFVARGDSRIMNSSSENDRLRRIFENDQKFAQIAAAVKRSRNRFAVPITLVGAWYIPIYYAMVGITWTRGGGQMAHPTPATWGAANTWAANTLWIGAAGLATLISACLAYGHKRRQLRVAVRTLLLIELVWTATALVFVNVIYNALVMTR
jgi:hypothetical protein